MTEVETKFWNATEHQLGGFGERVWANLLTAGGFEFVRLHDIACRDGKGPRTSSDIVLPDFETLPSGPGRRRFYIDSKCKKHRAIFRNAGNEARHGIDRKYWEHYSLMSAKACEKALLGIIELFGDQGTQKWSGRILAQTLGRLGQPVAQFGKATREYKDMVLWPADKFAVLAVGISADELYAMQKKPTERRDITDLLGTLVSLSEYIQPALF